MLNDSILSLKRRCFMEYLFDQDEDNNSNVSFYCNCNGCQGCKGCNGKCDGCEGCKGCTGSLFLG